MLRFILGWYQSEQRANRAWNSFNAVVHGFIGNHRADNYVKLMTDMIMNFFTIGCRMSPKMLMLHSHLDKFKNNVGAYSKKTRRTLPSKKMFVYLS